ncbi:unnamed protein product [Boreogadus saida]
MGLLASGCASHCLSQGDGTTCLGMCFALLITRRWDYLTGEMQFTPGHEAVAVNLVAWSTAGSRKPPCPKPSLLLPFQEKMTCFLPLKEPLEIVKGEDDLFPALERTSRNSKRRR